MMTTSTTAGALNSAVMIVRIRSDITSSRIPAAEHTLSAPPSHGCHARRRTPGHVHPRCGSPAGLPTRSAARTRCCSRTLVLRARCCLHTLLHAHTAARMRCSRTMLLTRGAARMRGRARRWRGHTGVLAREPGLPGRAPTGLVRPASMATGRCQRTTHGPAAFRPYGLNAGRDVAEARCAT